MEEKLLRRLIQAWYYRMDRELRLLNDAIDKFDKRSIESLRASDEDGNLLALVGLRDLLNELDGAVGTFSSD